MEVGNIFKLGTRYSAAAGATFLGSDGQPRPIVMGSYGIGVGRLLACAAEEHHDSAGLRLPASIAPAHVHLCALAGGDPGVTAAADDLYKQLTAQGTEVLYDDRGERRGCSSPTPTSSACPSGSRSARGPWTGAAPR